jgi:hypothetical protein
MNPFTALTSKIFAGLAGVLLIAVLLLWWQNGNLKDEIEAGRNALAECNAARAVQNAAIEAQRQEGERARTAFNEALASGQRELAEAAGRVRIVRQTAPNGCPTPPSIRGAGL